MAGIAGRPVLGCCLAPVQGAGGGFIIIIVAIIIITATHCYYYHTPVLAPHILHGVLGGVVPEHGIPGPRGHLR